MCRERAFACSVETAWCTRAHRTQHTTCTQDAGGGGAKEDNQHRDVYVFEYWSRARPAGREDTAGAATGRASEARLTGRPNNDVERPPGRADRTLGAVNGSVPWN